MSKPRKISRRLLTFAVAAGILGALYLAFRPQPTLVDLGQVDRGLLMVTLDAEGRTRVRESYIVSTPVAGRLMRVQVHSGDPVEAGAVVGQMRPTNPAALDARTREQARAAVDGAEAALRLSQANLSSAQAAKELAAADLERTQTLAASGIASVAALERAESAAQSAAAALDTASATISMREADLTTARAQLIGFEDPALASAANTADAIPLHAPVSGRILRILQESETVLAPGAPIMEIGDIDGDLEVVVDLLSSDAVSAEAGARVLLEDWGGGTTLEGEVARVEPVGATKLSALGVEEQRVGVIVRFLSPAADRKGLGDGYRLLARIVAAERPDVLRVPASALFATADGPALFRVSEGIVAQVPVKTGLSDGLLTEVLDGVAEGDTVVLYPSPKLAVGDAVAQRTVD